MPGDLDAARKRRAELPFDRRNRVAGFAHGQRFADAQDDEQAGLEPRLRLGPDMLVALALRLAPFGVPDDDDRRPGIGEHRRRDAAGMGAGFGVVNVLGSDR